MRQFEQDWLELGSRVARSLHYQHRRNLRLRHGPETPVARGGRGAAPDQQAGGEDRGGPHLGPHPRRRLLTHHPRKEAVTDPTTTATEQPGASRARGGDT